MGKFTCNPPLSMPIAFDCGSNYQKKKENIKFFLGKYGEVQSLWF